MTRMTPDDIQQLSESHDSIRQRDNIAIQVIIPQNKGRLNGWEKIRGSIINTHWMMTKFLKQIIITDY